ncbi:MAG: hypothetical protein ACXWJM_05065 [Ramlibacter sp.]
MKRLFSAKSLLVAAVALGAVGAASAAHARSDVTLSIGLNTPYSYGYVQSQPVYVEPQPVYVQPREVYVQPEVVYYGNDWRRREEWRHEEMRRHHGYERSAWADSDHDGVPNRYDRAPYNPYRR